MSQEVFTTSYTLVLHRGVTKGGKDIGSRVGKLIQALSIKVIVADKIIGKFYCITLK